MKKILCVANFLFGSASGAQSLARTHVEALYQAFGRENMVVLHWLEQRMLQIKKIFK